MNKISKIVEAMQAKLDDKSVNSNLEAFNLINVNSFKTDNKRLVLELSQVKQQYEYDVELHKDNIDDANKRLAESYIEVDPAKIRYNDDAKQYASEVYRPNIKRKIKELEAFEATLIRCTKKYEETVTIIEEGIRNNNTSIKRLTD